MAARILVIRGGAIGDFILTLPALGLLREAFPEAHLELLGYPHILEVANGRHYADAVRSIESQALAAFFNPKADLDPAWCDYFGSFKQVISYLFDPDGFFEGNLRRAGVRHLLVGSPKITDRNHAAVQLAEPLQHLALFLETPEARLFPTATDRAAAAELLGLRSGKRIAFHPGSGSPGKNWPIEAWGTLSKALLDRGFELLLIAGESDDEPARELRRRFPQIRPIINLPLPTVAAVCEAADAFVGHDSGISHLAAATGTPCLLLFGPTDPAIWAPRGAHVSTLRADAEDLHAIQPAEVLERLLPILSP